MRRENRARRFLNGVIVFLIISMFGLNLLKNVTPYVDTERKVFGFFSMVRYGLIDYPIKTFTSFTQDIATFWNLRYENDRLRQELMTSHEFYIKEQAYLKEIDALKKLNELEHVYSDQTLISGYVLNRAFDSWNKVITINLGEKDGVEVDDGVIASHGLIGRIISVNKNDSVVSLLTSNDEHAKLSVVIKTKDNQEIHGIVSNYDYESNLFKVQLMQTHKSLTPQLKVVTSGLGDVFAKGLYFGDVEMIESVPEGIGVDVYVRSGIDFNNIDYIKVVKKP